MNQRFKAGQFISFTYNPPPPPEKTPRTLYKYVKGPSGETQRIPVPPTPKPPVPPSDKSKQVLVLHPNWNNKIQAIDLARITPAEQQVLKAIMDPNVKAKVDAGTWPVEGVPPYPLVRDILARMDPVELIKNPLAFYTRLVKPFIRNKDCYRQYWPQYVFGVKVIEESHVQGHVTNPRPLFKKI
jgi:hypothetical protein